MKLVLSFVHPTRPSRILGPFRSVWPDGDSIREHPTAGSSPITASFSAVDGTAYADNQVFAFIDSKDGDWFCYDDGRRWAAMVLTDESGAGR